MTISIGLALVGIVVSGVVVVFGHRFGSVEGYWLLGIAAIAPAWLVSLLGFLTGLAAAEKGLRIYLVGASAAALLGVIATEYWVRRSRSNGRAWHPVIYWMLGIAALVPSWSVFLRGIATRS